MSVLPFVDRVCGFQLPEVMQVSPVFNFLLKLLVFYMLHVSV